MSRIQLSSGVLIALAVLMGACSGARAEGLWEIVITPSGQRLRVEPVATNLDTVWDMVWAPDGEMWVTERPGRVSRIDVRTGRVTSVGEIDVVEDVASGLLGMVFHPDFPREPWLYLIYSFTADADQDIIRNRLIRVRYENGSFSAVETLIDNIPGASIHNGGRLVIGPDRLLYMSMGDAAIPSLAQTKTSLAGKILRLTLEGKPASGNPFGDEVWSWGHRNPEGLAFQSGTGLLYSAEHGPSTDDEINLIEKGKNYGWPTVRGRCDTPPELDFCEAHAVAESVYEWTPTVGISGAAFYNHDLIPGWKGDLLATALVGQSLFRITLTSDGRRTRAVERLFDSRYGRLRHVLVGPDGAVYIATSNLDGLAGLFTRPNAGPQEGDDKVMRITPY